MVCRANAQPARRPPSAAARAVAARCLSAAPRRGRGRGRERRRRHPQNATAASAPAEDFYVVRRGDSLQAIAARVRVPEAQLLKMNSLKDPDRLYEGQRLRIAGEARRGDRRREAGVETRSRPSMPRAAKRSAKAPRSKWCARRPRVPSAPANRRVAGRVPRPRWPWKRRPRRRWRPRWCRRRRARASRCRPARRRN